MRQEQIEKNVSVFNADSKKYGGYLYTRDAKYSSTVSNEHITNNINYLVNIQEKNVYDVGCGDGTYTKAIFSIGGPKLIIGIDPAIDAIKSAQQGNANRKIKFRVGSIYCLSKNKKFDIAIVRGVLHHLYNPQKAISQVSKIADKVIIIEPNGYNLILKLIEKISRYHIDHEEKSYTPKLLDSWILKDKGVIIKRKFAAIVPFFCPEAIARILKLLQPLVESIPLINRLLCSSYYVVYETKRNS